MEVNNIEIRVSEKLTERGDIPSGDIFKVNEKVCIATGDSRSGESEGVYQFLTVDMGSGRTFWMNGHIGVIWKPQAVLTIN